MMSVLLLYEFSNTPRAQYQVLRVCFGVCGRERSCWVGCASGVA